MAYRGRFAPTASGPLHAGSLLCALAGWLRARSAGGEWLLRMDDLDAQRCRVDHADRIFRQLDAHGLVWDGPVRFQSQHIAEYESALHDLELANRLYACICSRAELARSGRPGPDDRVYAGTCRTRAPGGDFDHPAARVRVGAGLLEIDDACQGLLTRDAEREIGDFIVRRSDGQIAYQLASVVDDAALGVTEIVRGSDLIGSSFRQQLLRTHLSLPQPRHLHVAVLVEASGQKLSKQNHAPAVEEADAPRNLWTALKQLGQEPPDSLCRATTVLDGLQWALGAWQPLRLPAQLVLDVGHR